MEILLDASAIMAFIADEPESAIVIHCTKDAVLVSPDIISIEIANGLTRMVKKKVINTTEKLLTVFDNFRKIPLKILETDIKKALEIAWKYTIYAYDAVYLETAKRYNVPLLTFDRKMREIAREAGITVLGEKNASI